MKHNRLYISADIEGTAGVSSSQQTGPAGFEFQKARDWMTKEVTSACRAAFACGVKEVVVSDSHGSGQNLLLDDLPENVQVVRSWPRPLCMMEGIDHGNFDAAIFLGYHTGATDLFGVLAHTLSSAGIRAVRLNGEIASETVISAATAAHYGVPVIMVSGDDAYTAHAKSILGEIECATVKWSASHTSVRTLLPQEACELINHHLKKALKRLDDFQPHVINTSISVEVACVKRESVELLAYLPMFTRTSSTTIQFVAEDMPAVSRILSFLLSSGVL